jgi:hypothetical protein
VVGAKRCAMCGVPEPRGHGRTLSRRRSRVARDHVGVAALKAVNLAVKFVLELACIAAFAYWGASQGSGRLSVMLAIVAPAVGVVVWGVWAAPKSRRRLPRSTRVPFELTIFALAVVALLAAHQAVAAVVFAAVAVLNAALLAALGQLDE